MVERAGKSWPWLARVYSDDQPVGGGVLVAERLVLTCAHVITAALNREEEAERPMGGISLDFPAVSDARHTAHVLPSGWLPVDPDDETGDLAVLVLNDYPPVGVPPAPLRAVDETEGLQFRAIGFPRGRPVGSVATGEVRDRIGPGWQWAQLVSDIGPRVRKGYSGSPVWSEKHRAVIGVVVSEDTGEPDARGAAMLPLTVAAELWPPLADLIPSGILLDPAFSTHWDPKARGVIRSKDPGDYFTGRAKALSELADWLARPLAPGDAPGRLITGSPGTGKSAVLSRLAVLSDATYRARHRATVAAAPGTMPPEGSVDLAVHAAGLCLADVTSRLAAAAGMSAVEPARVVAEIVNRGRGFTLLVDALDEAAGGGEDIARCLLRPLAAQGQHAGVRVLIGGRPHLGKALGIDSSTGEGDLFAVLDLDLPKYFHPHDLFESIRVQLLLEQTPARPTPYRNKPELATQVAEAISARLSRPRANGAFLVGQIIAHTLANAAEPVTTSTPGWESHFATSVSGALEDRLAALGGSDARRARDLLRALAYGASAIPQSEVWVTMANAIARRTEYDLNDLAWLLDGPASSWLIQSWEDDVERVYSLYHQALADHLRPSREEIARQRDITASLLALVREDNGRKDWAQAPAYVLKYLSVHASAGGQLDHALLADAGYVLRADARILRGSVREAFSDDRAAEALLRTIDDGGNLMSRAERVEFNARQYGLDQLADDVGRIAPARNWTTPWAHLFAVEGALHYVEPHGCNLANAFGVAIADSPGGRREVFLGGHGALHVRELDDGGMKMRLGKLPYSTESTAHDDGPAHLAWVWGGEGRESAYPYGHTGDVLSVGAGHIGDRRAIVSGDRSGTVALWHLDRRPDCDHEVRHWRRLRQSWDTGDRNWPEQRLSWIRAVSLTCVDQQPSALACELAGDIHMIDAMTGEKARESLYYGEYLWCAATGYLNDAPILVAGGTEKFGHAGSASLRAWDLSSRALIGPPMSHPRTVRGVTLAEIDGSPVAATIDDLGAIRVWDVENSKLLREREHQNQGTFPGPSAAVAFGLVRGRRILVATGVDGYSINVIDFDSLKMLGDMQIGSEVQSVCTSAEYIAVGCVRGAATFTWRAVGDR